ncbi:MAG: type I restriction endonuclease subunit R [Aquificaceae bacterium]|uniref:type I restriction endonuclease subunit R n=1 Tax=Hydrogenobacter sp. Uz 6-8 TaxID=3384828 RepID=UPI0030B13740
MEGKLRFSERRSVQEPVIRYATQAGWKYISPEEVQNLRLNSAKAILEKVFIPKITELNPFLTEQKAMDVLRELERVRPDIHGNLTVWQFLKGQKTIYIETERRERNIKLIDTENPHRNVFHITDEFTFTNGSESIRQDVVFFINGIPVVFAEAKAPYKIDAVEEALSQVRRYHERCPELLAIEQAFVLTHLISFLYGATWNASSKGLYNWKEEQAGDFESLVKSFFQPERLLELITEYLLFPERDGRLQKVILRPHQVRAVNKILQRAQEKEKKRGLIWHTQGSGKTYTMIVTARRLIESPFFENPTVLMLVDRLELESQLFMNLRSVGIHVKVADSREELRRLLEEDTRGIIVSTIHKFEGMPANINTRENIFVLIDEAHRTTSGALGNYLMGALPNATFIGFTGTPIDRGRSTFVIFGRDDPPQGYLDKYSIAESIADGTTLPLHYSFAPSELTVDKKLLEEEFLNLKEAEGISDVEALDRILDKAVRLKNALKSRSRIEKVARYIAEHYREYVEPLGYKAFVVAVDREACALYKEELDRYLPPEYSRVVYSRHQTDPEHMRLHYLEEEEEKLIRKNFLDPEKNPKILIVTSKLLTGFDAPLLYCLYLDKPMRDHVLLQTIARVNRPYEDQYGRKKPAGLIVDFVGIFANLQKALAFDSADVEGVAEDLQKLKEKFASLMEFKDMEELREVFLSSYSEDKILELALEHLRDEEKREKFYRLYIDITDIYNILSPDPFLRPYLQRVEGLIRLYLVVRQYYEPGKNIDREFTKKVEELVRKHTKQGEIGQATYVYEINEEILRELQKEDVPDSEKVYNLTKGLQRLFQQEMKTKPHVISLAQKLENVLESYRRGQKSTQKVIEELKKLYEEYEELERERAEKGLAPEVFAIYRLLKREGIKESGEKAKRISELFSDHPHWRRSREQERNLRREIIKLLEPQNNPKAVELTEEILNIMRQT